MVFNHYRFFISFNIPSYLSMMGIPQIAALVQTALVAGIQSYTSYSTVTYNDAYGNFGYGTVRDYSWAGDRASDALTTVFNGSADSASLQAAWSTLNCY